jgi:hypothetical protein
MCIAEAQRTAWSVMHEASAVEQEILPEGIFIADAAQ